MVLPSSPRTAFSERKISSGSRRAHDDLRRLITTGGGLSVPFWASWKEDLGGWITIRILVELLHPKIPSRTGQRFWEILSQLITFNLERFRLRRAASWRPEPSMIRVQQRVALADRITVVGDRPLDSVFVAFHEPRHVAAEQIYWASRRDVVRDCALRHRLTAQIFRILQPTKHKFRFPKGMCVSRLPIPNGSVVEESFLQVDCALAQVNRFRLRHQVPQRNFDAPVD